MNGASHVIGGVTAAMLLGIHKPLPLAVVVISALLPDIDRSNSLLGRFIPVLPGMLEQTPGKRTLTHSLLFGLSLYLLLGILHPAWQWPFIVGYVSHLVLDVFVGRITLLWPLPFKIGVPLLGIPPIVVESASLAAWGAWIVLGGYHHFHFYF